MLQFKPVTKQDGSKLRKYYQNCEYGLCEYSVGTKMMWRSLWKYQWAEVAGCLVVHGVDEGRWIFDYPVPGPEGDEDAALTAIEEACLSGARTGPSVYRGAGEQGVPSPRPLSLRLRQR